MGNYDELKAEEAKLKKEIEQLKEDIAAVSEEVTAQEKRNAALRAELETSKMPDPKAQYDRTKQRVRAEYLNQRALMREKEMEELKAQKEVLDACTDSAHREQVESHRQRKKLQELKMSLKQKGTEPFAQYTPSDIGPTPALPEREAWKESEKPYSASMEPGVQASVEPGAVSQEVEKEPEEEEEEPQEEEE